MSEWKEIAEQWRDIANSQKFIMMEYAKLQRAQIKALGIDLDENTEEKPK